MTTAATSSLAVPEGILEAGLECAIMATASKCEKIRMNSVRHCNTATAPNVGALVATFLAALAGPESFASDASTRLPAPLRVSMVQLVAADQRR